MELAGAVRSRRSPCTTNVKCPYCNYVLALQHVVQQPSEELYKEGMSNRPTMLPTIRDGEDTLPWMAVCSVAVTPTKGMFAA